MAFATSTASTRQAKEKRTPYHVFHPSFLEAQADRNYRWNGGCQEEEFPEGYMPDEVTRDLTRRMHFAAYRMCHAGNAREGARWRHRYFVCRDRVVMGNRKLVYRAVRKWGGESQFSDDMIAECQVVLIQAVGAFNPWLGIRFSTYAFTCLMRALSRMSQRLAADRLARSVPLESLPEGEPRDPAAETTSASATRRLDEYLCEGHTLLTPREKIILIRRFCLNDDRPEVGTLEEVGKELGLSKERVRQVQATALGKLRKALAGSP